MNIFYKNTIITALLFLSSNNILQAQWKTEVEKNMDAGNLTQVETILKNLDENEKSRNRYDIDSLNAIIKRIRHDFSLQPADGIKEIVNQRPTTTIIEISKWIDNNYLETMIIDGKEMWFRKAVRNLWLLNPDLPKPDKSGNINNYRKVINEALNCKKDKNQCSNWQNVKVRYTLDVDADAVPAGETIKAWLPVPLTTARQKNVKITKANREYVLSTDSPHNTLYMEAISEESKPTHFEIEISYDVAAQSFTQDYLLNNFKPYDVNSDFYKKYTSADNRHIVVNDEMKALAKSIVGKEDNPVLQSSRIYNWITNRYPWAGARDYGTIKNIPEYVLDIKHGDCGQVALLYISLVRSLGIPARWESGWMLHPWSPGWHDWAETYFEGIGWVPTDVSMGRNDDDLVRSYYKTGTDVYRFASNCDYGKPLSPRKQFIRTEPIDFQAGEVEWRGGNIEGTHFDSNLKVIEYKPLK